MEIVYMLGNGFDLNLGLKTSYKSFMNITLKPVLKMKLLISLKMN